MGEGQAQRRAAVSIHKHVVMPDPAWRPPRFHAPRLDPSDQDGAWLPESVKVSSPAGTVGSPLC